MNRIELTIFSEEAFASPGAAVPAGGSEESAPQTPSGESPARSGGTSAAQPSAPKDHPAGTARREAFETLIQGKYREAFSERVQSIIDRRFKDLKTLRARAEKLEPLLEQLRGQYGAEDDDALLRAVRDSNPTLSPEASGKNAAPKDGRPGGNRPEYEGGFPKWKRDIAAAEKRYPSFRIAQECRNPVFVRLMRSGIDVATAYEFVHRGELLGRTVQETARLVRQSVGNEIRTRAQRPEENGMGARSAAVGRPDARRMTRQEREAISRRVLKGEKITF